MRLAAEDAEEGGHEPVVELVLAEELVDLGDDPRRLVGLRQRRAEHRAARGRDLRGPEAVAADIAEGDGQPAAPRSWKSKKSPPVSSAG